MKPILILEIILDEGESESDLTNENPIILKKQFYKRGVRLMKSFINLIMI